jgi:hypothetical protein
MLDFGSNVFLITDVEATRIGIPILRHSIALNTANGSSTILGVTPPLLSSYRCIDRVLQSSHCMLVIKSTSSTCFDLLIGNPDCSEFRAIHDTGLGTLSLSKLCSDPYAHPEPPVVLPVFFCNSLIIFIIILELGGEESHHSEYLTDIFLYSILFSD